MLLRTCLDSSPHLGEVGECAAVSETETEMSLSSRMIFHAALIFIERKEELELQTYTDLQLDPEGPKRQQVPSSQLLL